MPTNKNVRKKIAHGPTGALFARNLARLRRSRGLTADALVSKMSQNGYKLPRTAISDLENEYRRASVDDLMALAIALDVSPNSLILPPQEFSEDVSAMLTTAPEGVTGSKAWAWGNGLDFLGNSSPSGIEYDLMDASSNAQDIKQRAISMLQELDENFPGLPFDIDVLLMSAFHASKNLTDDESLTLWHVSSEDVATCLASIPNHSGDISKWIESTTRTVVAIATKSAESSIARGEIARKLKDSNDGND